MPVAKSVAPLEVASDAPPFACAVGDSVKTIKVLIKNKCFMMIPFKKVIKNQYIALRK
jgi:hypothetical protein